MAGVPELPSNPRRRGSRRTGHLPGLALTTRYTEVEAAILAAYRKKTSGAASRGLNDLRGFAYARPARRAVPPDQRRTYFKGMALRARSAGSSSTSRRPAWIPSATASSWSAIADSDGFRLLLDIDDYRRGAPARRFVADDPERDPDIIENHNIFGFDMHVHRPAGAGARRRAGARA